MADFKPSTAHAALGPEFYDIVAPARLPELVLRYRNPRWAQRIGLGDLTDARWIDHFGRFEPLPGSYEKPLALRYHGHQFQVYNPDLGDGRGFLFAQTYDRDDGRLLDLTTKGSGTTPWSRGADGRLTLKGGVREVLATEMLEALGVYTSKSISLIETGEELERHDEPSPTRGAVLVRLTHSPVRIGTFQRLAFLKDEENLGRLVDFCVETYLPDCQRPDMTKRAAAFLQRVAENVARLGASWIAAGFVHGVLNTDNINITGESFDYGPWRFLPTYDPAFTAAYFDTGGLYAFGRQPDVLAWNLTRLAECLVPLSTIELLEPALNAFWPAFRGEIGLAITRRLGVESQGPDRDADLVAAVFAFLMASHAPYEQVFFDWYGGEASATRAEASPIAALYVGEAFEQFRREVTRRPPRAGISLDHPYFGRPRPRTVLIEEMEALWAPIAATDDWTPLRQALDDIRAMGRAYS
jgi:protein adenylyltransferase